ncbi:MAG: MBL fold metallo-hydrolase [Candidatus Promineifilaceae bacterium]|nr:MBL fold metallo-hydrolase [Candidatus Promineifilaceae bacterium]
MKISNPINGNYNVTYTGHSTILIEMDGVRILTDPLLRSRVAHLGRLVAVPDIADLNLDAILISHMHWDHLDLPSLRLLGYDTHIIAPRGAGSYLEKKGFTSVEEIGRYEITRLANLAILATPAEHSGDRPFFGPSVDSLGYLIQGSKEIYFAGDTDLFPEMEVLSDSTDLALLPVWGYGPTLGAGHLDPYRAAQALPGIDPKVAIPIHWGTYCPIGMVWMQMAFLHYPPHSFQRFAKRLAPEVEIVILEPGQSLNSVDEKPVRERRPTPEKLDSWQASKLLKWQAKRYKG